MSANANPQGGASMGYRRGEGRHQTSLLPETLGGYIRAENPGRFLAAFVEPLALEQ